MGAILASILTSVLGWVFRTIVVKFFVMGVIFIVTSVFLAELVQYLPDFTGGLTSALSSFTPTMWYLMDIMSFTTGFPLVLSAYLARFAIRRIPFIG